MGVPECLSGLGYKNSFTNGVLYFMFQFVCMRVSLLTFLGILNVNNTILFTKHVNYTKCILLNNDYQEDNASLEHACRTR